MCNDHQADRVCIDQSDVENERYEMIFKDDRLEVKVCRDKSPSQEIWQKPIKRFDNILFSFSLDFHYMHGAGDVSLVLAWLPLELVDCGSSTFAQCLRPEQALRTPYTTDSRAIHRRNRV